MCVEAHHPVGYSSFAYGSDDNGRRLVGQGTDDAGRDDLLRPLATRVAHLGVGMVVLLVVEMVL